ncbi:MAG: hypothetical protein WDO56_04390 [Gammaproteobacteria bacterium]
MNAIVMKGLSFDISTVLPTDKLSEQFKASRRLHVANFLPNAAAAALSRHLVDNTSYRTYVVANEDEMATNPGDESILSLEEEREMLEVATDGARNGFASYFEANRSLSASIVRSEVEGDHGLR